jgi:DNA-binding response OmpR family regulator
MSLLFIEDHKELRINSVEILKNFFKKVISAKDGEEALTLYKKESKIDLIVTDIQMPNINGVEMIDEIYKINPQQSIIVLSAHDDSQYLLPLINLGIDHFIKKPVDYQELLKVLTDVSKKRVANTDASIEKTHINLSADFTYNFITKTLLKNKENVYLTKYELIFLQQLLQQPGKIYPNNEIVSNFSNLNEELSIQNIRKLVSKLRKKLPNECIESIYGIGYKINLT